MQSINTLNTVGATAVPLGDLEFVQPGMRILVSAADSVATATITGTIGGFQFILPGSVVHIEGSTDRCVWPEDIVGSAIAGPSRNARGARLTLTLGGTVAGCRVNVMALAPQESIPW